MAEAIVGPLLSKLQQVAVTEGKALAGVGNEIDRLRDKLMWLHALVHETDLRSRNDGNQQVRVLACQMHEVAFEAEDAIDSFFLEADLGYGWCRAAAKFFLNLGTQIRVRCILSGKIKSMNARLEDIVDSSTKYSTDSASAKAITWRASRAIPPARQNWENLDLEHSTKKQTKKTELEEHLNKDESLVICVVGESGVGKRHLVKEAYENKTIKDKFKVRIWGSFPPDTRNIMDQITGKLDEITRKLEEDECSVLPENPDQVLYDYLVVVDCPTTQRTTRGGSILQESLKGRKGSKIVLIATSCPLADAQNVVIIEFHCLLEDKSKVLFNTIMGLNGHRTTKYKTSMMNEVRQHIEEITNGLPLAVVLLARLMRTMNYNKWEAASNYIRNNHQDDQLNTIVSMCIDDLPDERKSCLLYTAGFPARSVMDAGQLVRLWMAEGFLAQQHGVEPEELGQRYLKEFIFRGIVQVVKKKGDTVESVALHDRVDELFRSEAQRTSFMETHYDGSAPLPDSARRLALNGKKLPGKNMVLTKLRTVLSHGHGRTQYWDEQWQSPRVFCGGEGYLPCPATSWRGAGEFCSRPSPRQTSISGSTTAHGGHHDAQGSQEFRQLLKHSNFLRVISLEGINIGEKLTNQIGNMLHLQYLGVRCCNLKKVPGSIGKLRKLQTMDVRGTQVKILPKSFWKIKALRCVLGDGLEFPESAGHLMMLNETVSVPPTTATEPEQSTGEAEKAESEESVTPPQATGHLETVPEPEQSTGEAEKAEFEESVASVDASTGLAIENKAQSQAEDGVEKPCRKSDRTRKPPERFSP